MEIEQTIKNISKNNQIEAIVRKAYDEMSPEDQRDLIYEILGFKNKDIEQVKKKVDVIRKEISDIRKMYEDAQKPSGKLVPPNYESGFTL